MLRFPNPELGVAQRVFLPLVIEHKKRLRPLSEEGDVNKRRVPSEKRLAASDSNIEKDISRSGENGIGRESKDPKGTCLGDALTSANTHISPNGHAVTAHYFLCRIIRG